MASEAAPTRKASNNPGEPVLNAPSAHAAGMLAGVWLDSLFGDPVRWHPVAGFGRVANAAERAFYADNRSAGLRFTASAVAPVLAAAFLLQRRVHSRPVATFALTAATSWTVLGGRSLRRAGTALGGRLAAGDLAGARRLVPTLCGRDPASLDGAGMARASIESIAENTSDAVVAPLWWAAVAGLPGLVGYRAVNTLDAMVGYRSPRYRHFGTAAARLDDVANYVPSRITAALTVLAAPAVGGTICGGLRAWRADAGRHPSPNAGQCEAATAGVLGVALGGPTTYGGHIEQRPVLGGGGAEPTYLDVGRAVVLSRAVQAAATAMAFAALWRRGR